MKTKGLAPLKKLLSKPKRIAIVTHWSPDGDAIGSSLGLSNFLQKKGHAVTVIVPNEYPEFLHWMHGHKQVVDAMKNKKKAETALKNAEIIFCLDFNELKRINSLGEIIVKLSVPKVLIDHHPNPSEFADYVFHKVESSSTAELVYDFIVKMGGAKLVDKHIANCLYTGIMTDTGSFRFPSTSVKTHRVVAHLMDAGAENSLNHNRIYDDNTENRLRLLGYALSEKLIVLPEFHTAFFTLNDSEHERFHYQKGDTEGLVNYALTMRGIVFAAFFAERDGKVKCSFRSKGNFDVNLFARAGFNGGGHKNAAGGMLELSLEEVVKKFKSMLLEYNSKIKKA
ncbi:MAG: bifunctional oligoribonuclease/PAP phosphatase NrnA [Bacteroidetes bacterium]|nr:bifunctional oligoribonuclease/PAP phosphatase NrnA [Bacteroidota bacterium]